MDNRIIELLSEEIRETKNLTKAVQEETREIRRHADAAHQEAKAAYLKAEAAWELVIMTRNELAKPFWKRWFGV